jgi:hypothetical protein
MKLALFILSAALVAPTLPAQTAAEKKGKELVEQSLKALGGDAFLRMQDRVEAGRAYSFYRERLTGLARARIYTRYLDPEPPAAANADLRLVERQAFGKDEDIVTLFNKTGGYQITYRGVKPLAKQQFERYQSSTRNNILYIFRERLKEPGMIIEAKGSDIFDNMPVDVVDFTDAENNVVTVFFHKSTHLPVRQSFFRQDPLTKDRIEETAIFGLWRDIGGGVQWPFHMLRERDKMKVYEIFAESVTLNNKLKDDLFALPSNLKMLPEKQ